MKLQKLLCHNRKDDGAKKKNSTNTNINSDTDKARSLLQSINPNRLDDYDAWLKIGMAAHSVGDNSLLYDWEQLSQKNSKYQSGECEKKMGII